MSACSRQGRKQTPVTGAAHGYHTSQMP
jgi:hypothetical protein